MYNMYLMKETPIVEGVTIEPSVSQVGDLYINFLCRIEGWKTKCKNLHWSAPNDSMHRRLDDLADVLSSYQDTLAEDYMGISGKVRPDILNGIPSNAIEPNALISEIIENTLNFYFQVNQTPIYAGIKSETETFIHNLNKIKYLFSLCI